MISSELTDTTLEVTLSVDALDASNATGIKAAFLALDLEGRERAVVDIAQVDFIDSSGIGALLSFYKQVGEKLTLRNPTPAVLSVLELLRLHRILEIEAELALNLGQVATIV
jgi:anti-sigma B factor antagonist